VLTFCALYQENYAKVEMALVVDNFSGGMLETSAQRYGGHAGETIGAPAAPVVVSIQEVLWQVQVIIPTEVVKIVQQVKNVQQVVEISQVGPFAVVTAAVPPPPAAYFMSQTESVSQVNQYIEPPAKTFSNLDSQALPKEGAITELKIRRSVSCPARISNVYATNFPCLCDNWSAPGSGRTVCKYGSRGLCHDEIVFGVVRMADCRRCHSDRCAALYRCFQDGMYKRAKKQNRNRQARRKRQQLALTSSSQESAAGGDNKHDTVVQLVTEVHISAPTMKA